MTAISSYIVRSPKLAGLLFLAVILAACLTTLSMVTDTVEQYRAREASLDMLSRLELASQRGANKRGVGRQSRPTRRDVDHTVTRG